MMIRPEGFAAVSGAFPRPTTERYRPIEIIVPVEKAAPMDPSRLSAEALSRVRRAPPPVEDDMDLFGYLLLLAVFLIAVWR